MAQQGSYWHHHIDPTTLSGEGYSNEAPEDAVPLVYQNENAIFVNPADLTHSNPSLFSQESQQLYPQVENQTASTISPVDRLVHANSLYPEASPSSSLDQSQHDPLNINPMNMAFDVDIYPTFSSSNLTRVDLSNDFPVQAYQPQSHVGSLAYSRSISQVSHTTSSMSGNTGPVDLWDITLPFFPLSNLEPRVLNLIAAADKSQHPPTFTIRNNVAVLDFTAFKEFLGNHPQAVRMTPSGAVGSKQADYHILALRTFQDVRPRRPPCTDEKSLPSNSMYQCTLGNGCSQYFKAKGDWKRHENTHFPQEFWLCGSGSCASNNRFLRKDRFLEHCNKAHPEAEITSESSNCFRYDVVGSQWPRECPYRSCGKNNFPTFDDRLEHVAKHYARHGHEHLLSTRNERSNDDQDRKGPGRRPFRRSSNSLPSKNRSDGSKDSGQDSSGAGSSGCTSSNTFSASSTPYWASNRPNNLQTRVSQNLPSSATEPTVTSTALSSGKVVAIRPPTSPGKETVYLIRTKEPKGHTLSEGKKYPISDSSPGNTRYHQSEPESTHRNILEVFKRMKNRRKTAKDQDTPVEQLLPRNLLKEHGLYTQIIPSHIIHNHHSHPVKRFVQEEVKAGPWITFELHNRENGSWIAFEYHSRQARDCLGEEIRRLDLIINKDRSSVLTCDLDGEHT